MKKFLYSGICIFYGVVAITGSGQAQALGSTSAVKSDLSGAVNGVSQSPVNANNAAAAQRGTGGVQGAAEGGGQLKGFPVPMTFELSGVVEEFSPSLRQIDISGQTLNIAQNVTILNLVNQSPVAPIKVGSQVGFETNQLAGGKIEIVKLWVLSSPK